VSIPLTIAVVGSYVLWDWKLSKKAGKEDEATELRMLDMKRNSRSQAIVMQSRISNRFQLSERFQPINQADFSALLKDYNPILDSILNSN
jgi:hypothetical protein